VPLQFSPLDVPLNNNIMKAQLVCAMRPILRDTFDNGHEKLVPDYDLFSDLIAPYI
jgi:hypothetical protein